MSGILKIIRRARLLLFFATLPLLFLVFIIYRDSLKVVSESFIKEKSLEISRAADSIKALMDDIEVDMNFHAKLISLCEGDEERCREEILDLFDGLSPAIERLLRIDVQGRIILSMKDGNLYSEEITKLDGYPLFAEVSSSLQPGWDNIRNDPWGSRTFALAVPVFKAYDTGKAGAGNYSGMLLATFKTEYLVTEFVKPLQTVADGCAWIVDQSGRILIHTAMPELIDSYRERDVGKGADIVPPTLDYCDLCGEKRFLAKAMMKYKGLGWEIFSCNPTGSMTIPVRIAAGYYLLILGGIIFIFSAILLYTNRLAKQAASQNSQLENLFRLTSLLTSTISMEDLIDRALKIIGEIEDIEGIHLCLIDRASGKMIPGGVRNVPGNLCEALKKCSLDKGGIQHKALRSREPVIIDGGEFQKTLGIPLDDKSFWMAIPVTREDRPIGVLTLSSRKKGIFTGERMRFLSALVEELSVIFDNILLFRSLKEKTALLEEAHRVKSDFLSAVSHELRTPLAVIIGFLSLLKDGRLEDRPEDMFELCTIANKRAQDLDKLINSLLDLTRLEEGHVEVVKEVFDPKGIIQDIYKLFLPASRKANTDLELVMPRKIVSCLGDTIRIGQILDNLLSNALKFTPPKGKITLGIHSQNEEIIFFVADTGPGIPEYKQESIFERFYQIDSSISRRYGGAGLGLTISRELAELMGGRLWVENRPEGGALFSLSLPSSKARAKSHKKKVPRRRTSESRKGLEILLIDDDRDFLKITSEILQGKGYSVNTADNGIDGLRFLYGKNIDLIVLDLKMPGFTGKQFLAAQAAGSAREDIPIIILTAATEKHEDLQGQKTIKVILHKPLQAQELVEAVDRVLFG